MSRLSSLLVQDGALPVKRMEQAFQRQVIYGGSLDTILLEMDVLTEEAIVGYLSRASGIPAAPLDLLSRADPLAARALTRAVAERFAVAPLAVVDGRLRVVVNDPPEHAWTQALARATGFSVDPLISTEIRLYQLLERQYGQPLPPRLAALATKLPAGPAPEEIGLGVPETLTPEREAAARKTVPMTAPTFPDQDGQDVLLEGRPEPVDRDDDAGALWADGTQLSAPTDEAAPTPTPAPASPAGDDVAVSSVATERTPRITTPFGAVTPPAEPEAPVAPLPTTAPAVTAPEEPVGAWREPGRATRPTAPLGRVSPPTDGGDGLGPITGALAAEAPQTPQAPVAMGSKALRSEPLPLVSDQADDSPPEGADAAIAVARERLTTAQDRDAIFDTFAAVGAAFLDHVTVLTVHGSSLVGRATFSAGQLDHISAATVNLEAGKGSVLRQAIESAAPYFGPVGADEPGAALLDLLRRPRETVALLLPVAIRSRVVLLLYGDRGTKPVSVQRVAPLLPLAQSVADAFLRLIVEAKGQGKGRTQSGTSPESEAVPTTVHHARTQLFIAPQPAAQNPPQAAAHADATHRAPTRLFTVAEVAAAAPAMGVPNAPLATQETMILPKATAPTAELDALVDVVENGEAPAARQAAEALVDRGPPALGAVMRRFPGRLLVDPRAARGRLPAAQHGPLLALVSHFGFAAVQALVVRLADPNPAVRFYATYLFSEIRAPEAVRHIHWRLYDADSLVRTAAIDALRTYEGTAGLRAVLEALRADLVDPDPVRRRVAAESLGELRDGEAVPRLIEIACSRDQAAERSLRALVQLTRVDFGTSRWRWRSWWDKNRRRHRTEWLIDALASLSAEHRMAAGQELARLAGQSFGYQFDLPKREREEARRRYAEWWEREGRSRAGSLPDAE
jgi:hypothetical protein